MRGGCALSQSYWFHGFGAMWSSGTLLSPPCPAMGRPDSRCSGVWTGEIMGSEEDGEESPSERQGLWDLSCHQRQPRQTFPYFFWLTLLVANCKDHCWFQLSSLLLWFGVSPSCISPSFYSTSFSPLSSPLEWVCRLLPILGKEMQGYFSCVDATTIRQGILRAMDPKGISMGY